MNSDLVVMLYEERALTVKAEGSDLKDTSALIPGPACSRLSAAWTDRPRLDQLLFWIEALMPENGIRIPFTERAQQLKAARRLPLRMDLPVEALWGNTDVEYTGAVSFRRDEPQTLSQEPGYTNLSEKEISERLYEAWRVANQADKGPAKRYRERQTSLSGARGKIGLTITPDGSGWQVANADRLNTWIAKHEDSRKLRGEAGVESISQRAITMLEIPAARTFSRVFSGIQAVLSQRADRFVSEESGEVLARHQEELCQAWAWPADLKYYQGPPAIEPGWMEGYELLRQGAAKPQSECRKLTRVLAACWAIGHTDLHRRNLGIQHPLPRQPLTIEIAPMYDVSSGIGIEKQVDFRMALPIVGQRHFQRIGPVQWIEHAKRIGEEPESVLSAVSRIVQDIPEAIAAAREEARSQDENRWQGAVDHRVERMIEYSEKRRKEWFANLGTMRAKGARGLRSEEEAIARQIQRLDQAHGLGEVTAKVFENGIAMTHTSEEGTERDAGWCTSQRAAGEALVLAKRHRPEDIPEFERSVAAEIAKLRDRPKE